MIQLDIVGLRSRLEKTYMRIGIEKVKQRAAILVSELNSKLKVVYDEIYRIMSNPASSRGFTGKHLNLHNSELINNGIPMMVTGALRDSFYWHIDMVTHGNSVSIIVDKGFYRISNRKGIDYGEILDNGARKYQPHDVLGGFKERIYDKMNNSINNIIRSKRFT